VASSGAAHVLPLDDEAELMSTTFDDLGLSADLVAALAAAGITHPFPIQAMTLPDALAGHDVCGKAKTGSGKTLAFGLALIERSERARPNHPVALVLVPTRELAAQVRDVLTPLAEARGRRVTALYGGVAMEPQIKALRRGVDIVIATPGRLIDLGDRRELELSEVAVLVLDEADRMADMGFMPQVEWVLRRLTHPHQTLLFSATLDSDVDRLVRHYLREPVFHEVASASVTVEEMAHRFLAVHQLDKVKVAAAITRGVTKTLVFVRTRRGADRLVQQLRREGVKALAIHGDLGQGARQRALREFDEGRVPVLVATDVAARGLDVEAIDVVLHFDPPDDHKTYLHRSGRTARAGAAGLAVTLVLWNQMADAERVQRRLGIRTPIVEVFSNDPRLADLGRWESDEVSDARPARPAPPRAAAR
jgi:superfamily II DNA/RNA helicase